jgi:uncharacterized protein (DUF697 family)
MASPGVARLGHAKSFWRILRSISVAEIEREAAQPVSLAIVGREDARAVVISRLYEGSPEEAARPSIREFATTAADDGFPQDAAAFDIVIDAGAGRVDPPEALRVLGVDEIGDLGRAVERLLDLRPDLALALARRFPGLRASVAARVIGETATANAQLAMLNALPGVVPALGVLLPTALLGDIVLLTKNQAIMMLRLAAAYGLPLDPRARMRDLGPLLGNAFGWRAVARELVAVVPGGVGVAARGAIAYSGTYTLGKAIQQVYALGHQPTRAELRGISREAWGKARGVVAGLGHGRRLPPEK